MIVFRKNPALAGLFAVWTLFAGFAGAAEEKLRVLIIDGQNNHNWRIMTPPMKADIERSGRFIVNVATTPDRKADKSAWDAFRPEFSKYDVVLSNYNGEPWPAEVRKAWRIMFPTAAAWRSSTPRTTPSPTGPPTTQ